MGYCVYMTRAGYELQAKLFADGGEFEVTRVMIGPAHRSGGAPRAGHVHQAGAEGAGGIAVH